MEGPRQRSAGASYRRLLRRIGRRKRRMRAACPTGVRVSDDWLTFFRRRLLDILKGYRFCTSMCASSNRQGTTHHLDKKKMFLGWSIAAAVLLLFNDYRSKFLDVNTFRTSDDDEVEQADLSSAVRVAGIQKFTRIASNTSTNSSIKSGHTREKVLVSEPDPLAPPSTPRKTPSRNSVLTKSPSSSSIMTGSLFDTHIFVKAQETASDDHVTRCHANHPEHFRDPTWLEVQGLNQDWERVRVPLADFGSQVLQQGGRHNMDGPSTKQLVNTYLWPTILEYKCFLDMQLDEWTVRHLSTEELLGVISVRFAWLATNTEEGIEHELGSTNWVVEWSLLLELLNWKLLFLHDFSRIIFPLLYFISDSLPKFQEPCGDGWENVFDVALPQQMDDLDLDLHESWCHFLTEGVLQREHLDKCPIAMAWLALNLAFINVAAQDRVQAFEYVHQAQAYLSRVRYLEAYRKDEFKDKPVPEESEDGTTQQLETQPQQGIAAVDENKKASSSISDEEREAREAAFVKSATSDEQKLLYVNPEAKLMTEEENANVRASIFERQITFPVHVDLRKFFGMQFPIWELMAKLDFFQGLAIQIQSDEEQAKKHLDAEMQKLSGLVYDDGARDGRHAWMLDKYSQFDLRETLGSGHVDNEHLHVLEGSQLQRLPRHESVARPHHDKQIEDISSKVPDLKLLLKAHDFPKISVVDVGAIQVRGKPHIYHRLLMQDMCTVIGFDPNEAYRKSYPNMILFPHFVGDGKTKTFHITQNDLSSSLLEPNVDVVSRYDQLEEAYKLVMRKQVQTVRLDDIMQPGGFDVDYLKVDVQGAEMMVLQGSERCLENVLVLDVEVHFQPLYKNMPLFADIDLFLRERGFVFHRLSDLTGRGMRPTRLSSSTLWCNAIYIKDVEAQYKKILSSKTSTSTSDVDSAPTLEEELKSRQEERLSEDDVFSMASAYNECVRSASKTGMQACESNLRKAFRAVGRSTAPLDFDDINRNIYPHRQEQESVAADNNAQQNSTTAPPTSAFLGDVQVLKERREKLIKQAIILHEVYSAMDVAMHSLSRVGKNSGLATRYYYKMVDSLPTEKYIPGKGTYEMTQGFRPPLKAVRTRSGGTAAFA
ncbi:unnamed protein product [Amoebophrya sp. A25]|nr:unnamed protein product [Amoebophrya sp. A25]|eukprot:GSA25T00016652001.1